MRIGLVGYGYWGPNLARNTYQAKGGILAGVCDANPKRLEAAASLYPGLATYSDFNDMLENANLDAVIVATPVTYHFPLAKKALEAGKHVFIEKPITLNTAEAQELIDLAKKVGKTLMVDHTFVYTDAVTKIKKFVEDGELGTVLYYDSSRTNLGKFQQDVDVFWDLAVHDLAVMDFILPRKPIAVSATGSAHVAGQPANIAYLTLFFEGDLIGHVNVNWLAPVKLRRTLIGGSKKMIVFDDLEPDEKIKIYDKGIDLQADDYTTRISYRTGDMWAPKVEPVEALRIEMEHFIDCAMNGKIPLTPGESGLSVVKILEAASESMAKRGNVVELSQ